MSEGELQLKEIRIKEAGRTRRKELEDAIWSKRIIFGMMLMFGGIVALKLILDKINWF